MRRLLLICGAVLLLLGAAGCGLIGSKLTVTNNSSFYVDSIQWGGYDFGALAPGASNTKNVAPAIDYVYISIAGLLFRTGSAFTVGEGHYYFTLTDSTLVIQLSLTASEASKAPSLGAELKMLLLPEPQ